jgi:uncharacterized membrane protein affecting hemolysin expression
MLTRKQYRTIKAITPVALTITALITITAIGHILDANHTNHTNQQVEQYKQCIIQQSQEHSYIIRSYCSQNYAILDQLSGLEYTQIGYDLYLK